MASTNPAWVPCSSSSSSSVSVDAKMPCLRAFCREMDLPSGVLGPPSFRSHDSRRSAFLMPSPRASSKRGTRVEGQVSRGDVAVLSFILHPSSFMLHPTRYSVVACPKRTLVSQNDRKKGEEPAAGTPRSRRTTSYDTGGRPGIGPAAFALSRFVLMGHSRRPAVGEGACRRLRMTCVLNAPGRELLYSSLPILVAQLR